MIKKNAEETKRNPPNPNWPTYKLGELGSFTTGIQTFTNAIAANLGTEVVRTSHKLTNLTREENDNEGGQFLATFETPDGIKMIRAKAVSLTCPAAAVADILGDMLPSAENLKDISYPPVAAVALAYKKEEFKQLPGGK